MKENDRSFPPQTPHMTISPESISPVSLILTFSPNPSSSTFPHVGFEAARYHMQGPVATLMSYAAGNECVDRENLPPLSPYPSGPSQNQSRGLKLGKECNHDEREFLPSYPGLGFDHLKIIQVNAKPNQNYRIYTHRKCHFARHNRPPSVAKQYLSQLHICSPNT